MQIGFSKKISEILIDDFFQLLYQNLKRKKKVKISNFGTFTLRNKKARIGRNPKTKVEVLISERSTVSFKPSKDLQLYINKNEF